jgi:hypothetical protein
VQHPRAEGDRLAELLGHAGLEGRGLPDPYPVPDDGPGGGLVRGPETDRAQPWIAPLQIGDDRVALADPGKRGPVHVQRQDSFDLQADGGEHVTVQRRGADHLSDDLVAVLPQLHPDRLPCALGRERQLEGPVGWRTERRGGEPLEEPGARGEGERPSGRESEPVHVVSRAA